MSDDNTRACAGTLAGESLLVFMHNSKIADLPFDGDRAGIRTGFPHAGPIAPGFTGTAHPGIALNLPATSRARR